MFYWFSFNFVSLSSSQRHHPNHVSHPCCYALQQNIKQAKRQYRTKIESYYTGSDALRMWQGLQTVTDYKGKHSWELPSDKSLPDELNNFYAHFEANNTETCMRASAVPDDCEITLSAADVSKNTRPEGQTDYQDVYSEHDLTNWQMSSLTCSTTPCLSQ